ncbi:STAS domain-containing protein [Nocardioides sp.]|uniref:STAS domain-containing protein n=1 Tax=Nocardioides sp. TaxID=35761 RepID=UPI0026248C4D|nr:STAS domain-containing protein [Nocardioides sp.]
MELIIERRGVAEGPDGVRLELIGALDLVTRDTLVEAGRDLLAGGSDLTLDMAHVTFIDSTGIGALIALHKSARTGGGTLRIVRPSTCVTRILEVTGLAGTWST